MLRAVFTNGVLPTASPTLPASHHSLQERIREDITDWLHWLRYSVGFDGWRLDFVRGFPGQYTKQYIDEVV